MCVSIMLVEEDKKHYLHVAAERHYFIVCIIFFEGRGSHFVQATESGVCV